LDIFLQQLVNGLTLGSVYALVALGYTMVYGIIELINFAHGEIFMLGGFAGYLALSVLDRHVHLALSVRDPQASCDFYLQTIGLDGEPKDEPWGVRVKFADGFMFALIQGDPAPASAAGAVHFGCALPSRGDARDLRGRVRHDGDRERQACRHAALGPGTRDVRSRGPRSRG